MAKITISEALGWYKTLEERHAELIALRNQNSEKRLTYLGANADKTEVRTPTYDVVKLDARISRLAREKRILDWAIKHTNATVVVADYEQDDAVLGELDIAEAATKPQ